MRFQPKLLLTMMVVTGLAVVTALVVCIGQPDSKTEVLVPSAPSHLATVDPFPERPEVGASQRSVLSLQETLALIHSKLLQWRARRREGLDDREEVQDGLMRELLAMITDQNAVGVVHSLSVEEMGTPFGVGALRHALQVDPIGITDWMAGRRDIAEAQTLEIADYWKGQTGGLEACIGQLPDTEWKQHFLASLGSEMSATNPTAAIEAVQQMDPGKDRTAALQVVACNWIATDPNAALSWVAGVQNSDLRDKLIASAVQSYALTDPAQAATWLISQVKSADVVNDAALNILKTWVIKDPEQAAGWVAQFPDGSTKTSAIEIISQHWQQTDPAAATAWIQTLSSKSIIPPN